MREIKFRAWDKKKKEWLLGYEMPNLGGFSIMGECMMFGEWAGVLNSRPLEELNDIKVMQYTGLKDKNNKEIYEADILWYESGLLGVEKIEVKYQNGFWTNFRIYEDCTILGNIYENPEILK